MEHVHFDSGHIYHYGASKMSESTDGVDPYGRSYWSATTSSGWACIDFGIDNKAINCVAIKAHNLNSCPKEIKIQGGFEDPRENNSTWKDLYSGFVNCVTGWQAFYLSNKNVYRYYRLFIYNTWFGENIQIDEWGFYENASIEKKVINQVRLRPLDKDSQEIYFPKHFDVYGSNNFNAWSLLGSFATYTPFYDGPYGRWQRYTLNNADGYWAYKLTFVGNWNGTVDNLVISEWEMVKSLDLKPTHINIYGTNDELEGIWASPDTTFDSGWIYVINDGINYIYDDVNVKYDTSDFDLIDVIGLN